MTGFLLIAFLLAVGLAVFLFEWGVLRSLYGDEGRRRRYLKQRLEHIHYDGAARNDGLRRRTSARELKLDGLLAALPMTRGLPTLLEQAGLQTPASFPVLISLGLGVCGTAVGWVVLRHVLLALAIGTFVAALPWFWVLARRARRLRLFEAQLPDAFDIIVRALRAGYPLDTALSIVAEELPEPVCSEFALVSADLNYGLGLKQALEELLRRAPSRALKAFVTAVLVQRETGGNLAEILGKISGVVRGAFRFQRRLRTLSAEGRLSINILAGAPLALALAFFLMAPDLISELYTNPAGRNLVFACIVMFASGFVWARRIIRIDI